jgi:sigma-70-like protein
VVLCYLEGKTNQEAAAQLRCPVGTIKGRLSRARQTLRDRLSRRGVDSYPGPRPSVGPAVDIAAAKPAARPATTRISRAAAAPMVAPNSGPRAGGGDQPLVTLSGNDQTTLHDLVISELDADNGLASLPGLKKNRSGHLDFRRRAETTGAVLNGAAPVVDRGGWSSLPHRDRLPRVSAGSYFFLLIKLLYFGNLLYSGNHGV